jgi:hypothetical protein
MFSIAFNAVLISRRYAKSRETSLSAGLAVSSVPE